MGRVRRIHCRLIGGACLATQVLLSSSEAWRVLRWPTYCFMPRPHWWPPRHSCAVADVYTEASPFDRMYLPPSATFDLHVGSSEVTHGGAWKPQTTTLTYCSAKRPSNCAGWELAAARPRPGPAAPASALPLCPTLLWRPAWSLATPLLAQPSQP